MVDLLSGDNMDASNIEIKSARYLENLKKFRLMDDDFMAVVFEDIPCTETLLRIILKRDDLIVKNVRPQYEIKNLGGRSVRLDIFAEDHAGQVYNVEVQRKDHGAVQKRARYNSSLIDAHITDPGDDYNKLGEVYVIFITEHDVLKAGRPIYHIDRTIEETGEKFNDGSHIIYVNSLIQDETELGQLMHDFFCTDPDDMNYKILSDRVRYFKESEKGVKTMCKIMEELREEGYNEGWAGGLAEGLADGEARKAKETACELFKEGWPAEKIAKIVKYDVMTVEDWVKECEDLRS